MGVESGRHLWRAATISLLFWALVWLLAFAILPFEGTRFWYLFFGIGEPFLFLIVFLAPERSAFWASFVALLVILQFLLHVTQFILRILLVSRPFNVDQLLDLIFVMLEAFVVFIYVWYSVCAVRHYLFLQSEPPAYYNVVEQPVSETTSTNTAVYQYGFSNGELKQRKFTN